MPRRFAPAPGGFAPHPGRLARVAVPRTFRAHRTGWLVGAATAAASAAAAGGAWWYRRAAGARRTALDEDDAALLAHPPRGRPVRVTSPDGTRLHAEVFGPDDAPTIVLVHGWTCALEFWAFQLRALSEHWRVVAYDLRGHARSQRAVHGDYSTDALAADIDAVLRTCVPAGERVVLVGHSMGAMSIVAWAGQHLERDGDRVAGVVLLNTATGQLLREALLLPGLALLPGMQRVSRRVLRVPLPIPTLPGGVGSPVVRWFALNPDASPAVVAFAERMSFGTATDVRAAFGGTLAELDLERAVAALSGPTLVIVGALDKLTPPVHARRLVEALPHARLVELEGVGHMAPLEAPSLLNEHLDAFAGEALGARPAQVDAPPPRSAG